MYTVNKHATVTCPTAFTAFINSSSDLFLLISLGDVKSLELNKEDALVHSKMETTDCTLPPGRLLHTIASRRHLRSASRHHLTVPRHRLSTFGRRAFSIAGPTVWNSLPDSLRDPALSSDIVSDNCWRRTYFGVTTEYTQRSRDA